MRPKLGATWLVPFERVRVRERPTRAALRACRASFEALGRLRASEARFDGLLLEIVMVHGPTITASFAALEPWPRWRPCRREPSARFVSEPARRRSHGSLSHAAAEYLSEVQTFWSRQRRMLEADTGLDVCAIKGTASERVRFVVSFVGHGRVLAIADDTGARPTDTFFERLWRNGRVPERDIGLAARLLEAPHDVEWFHGNDFVSPRPPRSAGDGAAFAWLRARALLYPLTREERRELRQLAQVLAVSAPPRLDDRSAWTRWALGAERA